MSLGDQIARNPPYLRRYARALTGSQAMGDAFVRATLEAALADSELNRSKVDASRSTAPLTRSGRAHTWMCRKPSVPMAMKALRRTD